MKTIENLINDFDYKTCLILLNKLKIFRLNGYDNSKPIYKKFTISDLIEDTLNMYGEILESLNTDNELSMIKQNYGLKLSIKKGDYTDYSIENNNVMGENKYGIQFELEFVPVWAYVEIEAPKINSLINDISVN